MTDVRGIRDAFVTQPRQAAVGTVRSAATAIPEPMTPGQQAERAWAQAHPAGAYNLIGTEHVDLWNFDVGSATFKAGHIEGLRQILGSTLLGRENYDGTFTCTGYASKTGGQESYQVAVARARAAVAWLRDQGYPKATIEPEMGWPAEPGGSGTDPLAQARNRAVAVQRTDPPAPVAAPVNPDIGMGWITVRTPPAASATPATAAPGAGPEYLSLEMINQFEIKVPIGFVVYTMPPPQELTGTISVKGDATFTFKTPVQDVTKSLGIKLTDKGAAVEAQAVIAGDLKAKFSVPVSGTGLPEVGFAFGSKAAQWNWSLQPKATLFKVTSGAFLYRPYKLFTLYETQCAVTVSARFEAELGPGPGLLTEAGVTDAELDAAAAGIGSTAASAGEIGMLALAALSAAVIMYITVTSPEWISQQVVDLTNSFAARTGFAARVAIPLIPGSTGSEGAAYLQDKYGAPAYRGTIQVAAQTGYDQATAQLRSLAPDTLKAQIAKWTAAYAQDKQGHPLPFDQVAGNLFHQLGGVSSTAPPPSLDEL
jgi:outer membrane protein OmpA-like peptidoglycan-associated protein